MDFAEAEAQVKVLNLSGRFDAYNSPSVQQWLEDATQTEPAYIVVNLKDVTFVDSTGLSTLIYAMKRARELDGEVRLCCLQSPVRMLFELTRLDKVFEIFTNEEDAIKAFI
jgi:anti-anti-sigma factor